MIVKRYIIIVGRKRIGWAVGQMGAKVGFRVFKEKFYNFRE